MPCYIKVAKKKETDNCKRKGGLGQLFRFGNLSDVQAYTRDVNGNISGLTLKAGTQLFTFRGVKLRSNIAVAGSVDPNAGRIFAPTLNVVMLYDTQTEKEAIASLLGAENLFCIYYEAGRKKYVCEGLPLVPADLTEDTEGLSCTALTMGSGTAATDDSAATATFTGSLDDVSIDVLIPPVSGTATLASTEAKLIELSEDPA